jgi:hypothetical protein
MDATIHASRYRRIHAATKRKNKQRFDKNGHSIEWPFFFWDLAAARLRCGYARSQEPSAPLIENGRQLRLRECADRVTLGRDLVVCVYFYGAVMKILESKRFFSIFDEVVGSNAECYPDEMLPKLS